jgi:hypothetical protein
LTLGIAIDLGQYDIQPGQTGEVTVQIGTVRGMLFKASAQEAETIRQLPVLAQLLRL